MIPGNDDAIRAGRLMCRVIADAVAEGRYIASRRAVEAANRARRASQEASGPAPGPVTAEPPAAAAPRGETLEAPSQVPVPEAPPVPSLEAEAATALEETSPGESGGTRSRGMARTPEPGCRFEAPRVSLRACSCPGRTKKTAQLRLRVSKLRTAPVNENATED